MKIGFIFAGQGQQFLNMGQDLVEAYPEAKKIYDEAKEILGYDVLNLDKEQLEKTKYTQVALFTLGVVLDTILKKEGIKPDIVAGLSLGEYNALYSSSVFDFETGLKLIQKRAQLMNDAFDPFTTGMAACLRTDEMTIEALLKDTNIEICNVNTPTQIVIGGLKKDLDEVLIKLKENKVRAIPLKVSTVSHMSLLSKEAKLLEKELKEINFNIPKIPFINNVDAKFQENDFVRSLSLQISNRTLLAKTIQLMIDQEIDTIIEVGPKKTIVSFVKEISKETKTYNVYDLENLKELLDG